MIRTRSLSECAPAGVLAAILGPVAATATTPAAQELAPRAAERQRVPRLLTHFRQKPRSCGPQPIVPTSSSDAVVGAQQRTRQVPITI